MVLYSIAARAQGAQPAHQPNVGYVPTSDEAVQAMLKLAGVTKSDVVYDLGCGDGRIVITAAKVYGARGVGIDIDPQRIAEANANAEAAGVRDLVRFEEKDLFEADIHDASVVTLFLLSSINLRLRPKLLHDLKPGTRVVSNTFGMGDWKPARKLMVKTKGPGDFFSHQLLMWIVPSPAR
jgi:ribosomal protein L11 methylase PrmA